MKTFKSILAVLLFIGTQSFTSCLKSDSNGVAVTINYTNLYNAVVSNNGETTLYPKQSIKVDWGYDEPLTATIQINGLQLPNLGSFPSLQFNDVPWKVNNRGWMEISMANAKPSEVIGYVSNLSFDRFTLQTVNRSYNGSSFPPCLYVAYTINEDYTIYSLPAEIIEIGKTTVTNLSTGESFEQDSNNRSIYYLEFDPSTKTCFLVIQGAQFAQNMPGLNMKFAGIPFVVNIGGNVTMNKDEIIPALINTGNDINQAGTPAPGYPITEFRASFMPTNGLNISFKCTPHTKDGVPMGTYLVNFVCQYPTSQDGTIL